MMKLCKPFYLTALLLVSLLTFANASAQDLIKQQQEVNMMNSFLELIDNYHAVLEDKYEIASDAEKSAILNMQKIQEISEEMGNHERANEVFRKILSSTRNKTIRNAAYVLLADNLKETGQRDAAFAVLEDGLAENINSAK